MTLSPTPKAPTKKRICIVRLGAMGDIVHTLPLAAHLMNAGYLIDWVCESRWAPLLEENPFIDRCITLPPAFWKKEQRSHQSYHVYRRLIQHHARSRKYKAVIDAQGLLKSAYLARGLAKAANCPLIGHGKTRAREMAWAFYQRRVNSNAVHVIDQQLDLAQSLCPPHKKSQPALKKRLLPDWQNEQNWAKHLLKELRGNSSRTLLIGNIGAGWPTKVWPETSWTELIQKATAQGFDILLLWGNQAENETASRLYNQAQDSKYAKQVFLAPNTSIPQMSALLDQAQAVISGDTGPLHITHALGTPAIGLFGPVPAERNGPRGNHYHNFQAPGAMWERKDLSKVNMAAISADEILAALKKILVN